MLRLGGSQVLLTNRDVTRTLNPKRTRRPPTYLYTKGKQPLRSSAYPASTIPHINTSRPSTSSQSGLAAVQTGRAPSMSSAPMRPSSPDWSTSSDTEFSSLSSSSSSSESNMPEQPTPNPSTDGAGDDAMANLLREMGPGPYRQVISLETIDSFPFLPYRPAPSLMFRIYEDPVPPTTSPVGGVQPFDSYEDLDFEPFPYLGSSYDYDTEYEYFYGDEEDYENMDDNAWYTGGADHMDGNENEQEDDDEEEVIILNEMMWDPDTMLVAELQARLPPQGHGVRVVTPELEFFRSPSPE
ncbi:hypothetical protein TWF481_005819 [Arthrobotrys musiformis]|uniref:Transcription factor Iwr1 domain-containing protein n=1 Tax=Arthrobotrys musiformis TaxID=47236 RepID=A0AAV9WGX4_9PEZI